ncbi:ABC transporter permease subunit [Paenibacillus sp. PL2-23]|uniref:ABC transporter permease subunit n=1 Tax=Paenibacillus sp. PL2-23 TaxID=2100729 RepID=UPI0030F589C5
MNIWRREMKASLKPLLIWMAGIVAMVGSGMAKFAGMAGSGTAMSELMGGLPKPLQAVFGLNGLDISTVMGYYGMLYMYLLIMAAVHASMLGANVLAKEERDKTAEFLFVKPISRARVLLEKLLAVALQSVLFTAVMAVSSIAFVAPHGDGGAAAVAGDIWPFMAGMLLTQSIFGAAGLAIAASSSHPQRAVGASAGVMLLAFLLSVVIDMSGRLEAAGYLTPFQYFAAERLLGEGLELRFIVLSLGIALASITVAFLRYGRRDMRL